MYSKNPDLDKKANIVEAALIEFYEQNPKKENPYDGMC